MKQRREVLLALLAVGAAPLGGCGFALRGSGDLPAELRHPYIQTPKQSAFLRRELRQQLTLRGATVVDTAAAASAVLRILEDDSGQRILSVTTTGGPEEFEVYSVVRFELTVDGKRTHGPTTLTLRRDYTFNKNDVLGKRREYETLRDALARAMAGLIIRRIAVAPTAA